MKIPEYPELATIQDDDLFYIVEYVAGNYVSKKVKALTLQEYIEGVLGGGNVSNPLTGNLSAGNFSITTLRTLTLSNGGAGSAGQTPTLDGAGNLTWATPSGSGNVTSPLSAALDIGSFGIVGYTASRLVVTNANGNITVSSVTATEAGHLSGVTSAIQTQINTKAATTYVDAADTILDSAISSEASARSAADLTLLPLDGSREMTGNLSAGNQTLLYVAGIRLSSGNGTNGQVPIVQADGNLAFGDMIGGGNATPGGSNTAIQFNDDGAFGGDEALISFDKVTGTLAVGNVTINGGGNTTVTSDDGLTVNVGGILVKGQPVDSSGSQRLWFYYDTPFDHSFIISRGIDASTIGALRIGAYSSNGSVGHAVELGADGVAIGAGEDYYLLPWADGDAGQALVTDGAGTVSWASVVTNPMLTDFGIGQASPGPDLWVHLASDINLGVQTAGGEVQIATFDDAYTGQPCGFGFYAASHKFFVGSDLVLELDGGGNLGVFDTTPVGQQALLTPTQDDLTDSTGGTPGTTLADFSGGIDTVDATTLLDCIASLAAQLAKVKDDLAAVNDILIAFGFEAAA